jgi:hypothetical protein
VIKKMGREMWRENPKERDHLKDPDLNAIMILK